jgi:peptidoglycan/LPS O-acetylase OafA/YrhL
MTSHARGLYIPSLDGLRCIAILLVFLSHAMAIARVPRFVPGNFGVTLFFFLSGYLITTLMRIEAERTGTVNIKLFYVRRALRIFPTFYLVLAATALYGWYDGVTDPWFLLGQALHLTNYEIIWAGWKAPIAPYTDVYWSLAVEEHFYLVFPAVFVFMMMRGATRQRLAAWLLGTCGLVLLWRCYLVYALDVPHDRTYMATDTRIDSILFGCVLALWGNPILDPSRISESMWKKLLLPLSIGGLLLSFAVGDRAFREAFGYTLQGLCLFSVFVVAVRYPTWGVMRLLNTAPARWIGLLSFAIYLIHPSMLVIARETVGLSFFPLTLAATALTLAGASILYYGIERPLGRLRRRFSAADGPAQPAASDPARSIPARSVAE